MLTRRANTAPTLILFALFLALATPTSAAAQPTPDPPTAVPAEAEPAAPAGAETAPPTPTGDEATATGDEASASAPTEGEASAPASGEASAPASGEASAAGAASSKAAASGGGEGAAAGSGDEEEALPEPEAEAQGTCRTPRQAWLQLLYWLQKSEDRWKPREAAKCFDQRRLGETAASERAAMLKEILDAYNAWIEIDDLPTNPKFRDNATGTHRYVDPVVHERIGTPIVLYRQPNTGRWLFSADALDKIPELYPETIKGLQDRLPSWSKWLLFGIEIWKYLLFALLVGVALVVKSLVVALLERYMRRLIRHSGLSYLDRFVERAQGPIGGLAMALVFSVALPYLLLPAEATRVLSFAVEILVTFSAVWLGYRLVDVLSDYLIAKAEHTDSKLDDQLVPLVSKTLKLFTIIIGGIFILQNRGVNVGSLLAGLGIGGLAVALAAKDTLANFFGSVMIFIDKPFQIGDWVVIESTEGVIEEVGFRTSRVRTFYNSLVTVPNAVVTNSMVDNYGARRYRRYSTTLGLTYDTPPEKVEAFCEGVRALIARTPGMRKDFYMVEFKGFGATSLEIMVYSFMATPTWNEEMRTRTNLNLDIMRLAADLGVSFAFPTQTLHIETMAQLGESRPSHSGPSELAELASVVNGYGPDGERGVPKGQTIAKNYDCDAG